VQSHNCLYKAM